MTSVPPYLEPLPVSRKAEVLGPVWPKYHALKGLQAKPLPLAYAYMHSIMTPDRGLMLVKNSKCGCTSAAQKLFELATGRTSGDIHRERRGVFQGKQAWKAFDVAKDSPDTVVFSVTRHPVSRTVSAFKDFFMEAGNRDAGRHAPAMAARGLDQAANAHARFDIFLDYIEETLALDAERCDRHWRPQTLNLALDQISYTRLCRLENYAEDIGEVLQLAGVPADAGAGKAKRDRFNATRTSFQPSDAQVERIRNLYAMDFAAFGYD